MFNSVGGAVTRRTSVWAEIARDRQLRQRHNAQAARIHQQIARSLAADADGRQRAKEKMTQALEKKRSDEQRLEGLQQAEQQNGRLAERVEELTALLRECVKTPPLRIDDLRHPLTPPFDPGEDGRPLRPPPEPVMESGGLLSWARRRKKYDEAVAQHAAYVNEHHAREGRRRVRLAERQSAHRRATEKLVAEANDTASRLETGLGSGQEEAVEQLAAYALEKLPIPAGIKLEPRLVYRREPRELVVEIHLPDISAIPAEKSVKYVHTRREFDVKDRPRRELEGIYRSLLAELPLAVLHVLFKVFSDDIVESATVNGILPTVDSATGRPTTRYLVSVTTGRPVFNELILESPGLDPVDCIRALGAKLSPHPLDYEEVPAFLTFETAKYRLAPSVDVASGLDSRTDISTMDWVDFEQLVRQLLCKMTNTDVRVTRRSRDDGIDGVLFDCHAMLGGEFVVQAKRHRRVVQANDVRALAGVMHDKRANHSIFVTTAWFSDDGRRFALNNRVRLIEGPELKHLLRLHLGLDVLVSSVRRVGGTGSA
jgi:restriction system protein